MMSSAKAVDAPPGGYKNDDESGEVDSDEKEEDLNPYEDDDSVVTARHEVNFPYQLHYVINELEKEGKKDIIAWLKHGRAFRVKNKAKFLEEVLGKWFRQHKYASFQRQLNLYGFKRIGSGQDKGAYYHILFLRSKRYLCKKMKRERIKGTVWGQRRKPATEVDFYSLPFLPDEVVRADPAREDEKVKNQKRPPAQQVSRSAPGEGDRTVGIGRSLAASASVNASFDMGVRHVQESERHDAMHGPTSSILSDYNHLMMMPYLNPLHNMMTTGHIPSSYTQLLPQGPAAVPRMSADDTNNQLLAAYLNLLESRSRGMLAASTPATLDSLLFDRDWQQQQQQLQYELLGRQTASGTSHQHPSALGGPRFWENHPSLPTATTLPGDVASFPMEPQWTSVPQAATVAASFAPMTPSHATAAAEEALSLRQRLLLSQSSHPPRVDRHIPPIANLTETTSQSLLFPPPPLPPPPLPSPPELIRHLSSLSSVGTGAATHATATTAATALSVPTTTSELHTAQVIRALLENYERRRLEEQDRFHHR